MLTSRAFRPRRENSHRSDDWKRCEPFRKWQRTRPCFLSLQTKGHRCEGKVRSCHFDPWGDKGIGTKVNDVATFPMCDKAHAEQHSIGWPRFQSKYGFDGRDVVTAYWLEWLDGTPMGRAWKAKQEAEL